MSGSGISWAICKSALCSRQITMPAPHHSVFYRPDALPAAQPTASKHWRHKALKVGCATAVKIYFKISVTIKNVSNTGYLCQNLTANCSAAITLCRIVGRFLRHVPVVYVDYPGQTSLVQIYGTFNRAMLRLIPSLRAYAEPLTNSMVELYLTSQVCRLSIDSCQITDLNEMTYVCCMLVVHCDN